MGFGCGHVKRDETIHEASWGARLIYSEVIETKGMTPVVWDRQTPTGDEESVRLLFPVIDRAIDEFRKNRYMPGLTGDGRGRLCWRDGRVLVVMSPQGSYGYLYVTAVLERNGHMYETPLAAFEDDEIPLYGNWPPEVVEARRQTEAKRAEESLKWLQRDLKWAQDEVRYAKTDRARKMRQKKVDEIERQIEKAQEVVT